MKIAIVIGHHKRDKGAFSETLQISEYEFYKRVVEYLKCIPGVSIFEHDSTIGGYTTRIKTTARKINKYPFDLVMELHFNAATPQANGCETLYYFNSKKGKQYAVMFSEIVNQLTGIKIRGGDGSKALVNKNDRGFASVYYTEAPTILIEPFFGSNESDCKKIEDPKKVAEIIKCFLEKI